MAYSEPYRPKIPYVLSQDPLEHIFLLNYRRKMQPLPFPAAMRVGVGGGASALERKDSREINLPLPGLVAQI